MTYIDTFFLLTIENRIQCSFRDLKTNATNYSKGYKLSYMYNKLNDNVYIQEYI